MCHHYNKIVHFSEFSEDAYKTIIAKKQIFVLVSMKE